MSLRIAFRSPNWLGDAVMATVVPRALRRAHADATIHVVTPSALCDLFSQDETLDEVVGFERGAEVDVYRSRGYDHVLLGPTSFGSAWRAMRGGVRRRAGFATSRRAWLLSGKLPGTEYRRDRHQVENYRALAGLLGEPREEDAPRVHVAPAWRESVRERWPDTGAPRVVLQPGATYGPAKRWAPDRFAEIANRLAADGVEVAVVGAHGDREPVAQVVRNAPEVLDLCGRTTIGELTALLEGADLVITNDTGPMHLAAAVGTRTLAIFGSTSPVWTRPFGEMHRVLTEPVPCSPCFQRECGIGYLCLEGIPVDRVLDAGRELLGRGVGA